MFYYQTRLKMAFWLSACISAFCAIVVIFQLLHLLTWPEVEAEVTKIRTNCMAEWNPSWASRSSVTRYYPCDDPAEEKKVLDAGFTKRGPSDRDILVEFKTREGQVVGTEIKDTTWEFPDAKLGSALVRYATSSPQDAQFTNTMLIRIRVFTLISAGLAAFAYFFGRMAWRKPTSAKTALIRTR